MRRFVTSVVLLLFAIPFGASISGCHHAAPPTYCNGENSGVQVGQLTTLDLEPRLTGISLNQGQIGQASPPSGKDCRGDTAGASGVIYASTNITLVDVQPTTGRLCAGTWNRNTGGGIADFTYCTAGTENGTAYLTASSGAVVSNPIPVYVHPIVTSIVLGPASSNCISDPASNCALDPTQSNGCSVTVPTVTSTYNGTSCLSQGQSTQLVARTYAAVPPFAITSYSITSNIATFNTGTQSLVAGESVTLTSFPNSTFLNGQTVTVLATGLSTTSFEAQVTSPGNVALTTESGTGIGPTSGVYNVSCLVGPLSFSAQNASVLSITTNGLATAAQPGASTINAAISQASSTAGFFSTCPPKSIVLSAAGAPTTAPTVPIPVDQNSSQSLVATVTDTQNNPITAIQLTYISTTPPTIPANGSVITPPFPGAAAITAVCQPPTCNYSPFDEIGLFGNGLLVTSNPVQIDSIGTNFSTVLYMASTNSQYLLPFDFTLSTQSVPIRLPYAPNSMVLSTDLTTIYMGTSNEIMIFGTANNTLTKEDTSVSGNVIAVSPDSGTVIITDPVRQLVYLYGSSGNISAEYGGVATRASFSPDSQTVYITTTDGRLLVYSTFTGWTSIPLGSVATDVTVTVPNAGAYLAEGSVADVRTNCPATTVNGTGLNQTTTNVFYPSVGLVTAAVNRLASTNDGLHIFGANNAGFTDISTNKKSGACPVTFTSSPGTLLPFTTAVPTAGGVNNIITTSDAAFGFVTFGLPTSTLPAGSGGVIPQYNPATATLTNVPLQTYTGFAAPIVPLAAVVSGDNNTLYVGTNGDNLVHRLFRGTSGFGDTLTPINPLLPLFNGPAGQYATPNLLAEKPRKSTT
jgi:trimeric autotransporter adhesin